MTTTTTTKRRYRKRTDRIGGLADRDAGSELASRQASRVILRDEGHGVKTWRHDLVMSERAARLAPRLRIAAKKGADRHCLPALYSEVIGAVIDGEINPEAGRVLSTIIEAAAAMLADLRRGNDAITISGLGCSVLLVAEAVTDWQRAAPDVPKSWEELDAEDGVTDDELATCEGATR